MASVDIVRKRIKIIARVIVEKGPEQEFDYSVPDSLAGMIFPGCRVRVPFGHREVNGTVSSLADISPMENLKSVIALAGREDSTISPRLMGLADWIASYYCAPRPAVFRSMLPAPVRHAGQREERKLLFVELADPLPAKAPSTRKRQEALADLRANGGGPLAEIVRRSNVSSALLRGLEDEGHIRIEARANPGPLANRTVLPSSPPVLMPEQEQALATIKDPGGNRASRPHPVLLYGVTGSGKTEVYLGAIEAVLESGGGAIVMVPEIALTPQTVQRFIARFGDTVALLHSALGQGDRRDAWRRIHQGRARVVVGPRSAVFAPVARLGLIVVDEEHEASYKQDEAPRYHARDVAVMRAYIEGCTVVLGSATPSLESWRNASSGKYRLAKLPRRVDNRQLPRIQVVDMRKETARSGRMPVFSRILVEAVTRRLERHEQIMLFLNRRGFSPSLVCPACGYVETCEDCSVSRTYHRHDERLRCHICGRAGKPPASCPQCGDKAFLYAGAGTQRIEQITHKLFPRARIQRMDADVTRQQGSHEKILAAFRAHKTDILIGTQMIAKGLDFPNVTLVGVLAADLSLHMPDFRAGERTFQLLAQVAGRAGRGAIPGEVVVQTCTPEHRAIQAAKMNDFEGFARAELADRASLSFPPYSRLACLTVRGENEEEVLRHAELLRREMAAMAKSGVAVSEPAPAPLAKAKRYYRYQIILRSASAGKIAAMLRQAIARAKANSGIHLAIDMDAINLM